MLKVYNVEVSYHGVILGVRGVSLEVPKGAVVALQGNPAEELEGKHDRPVNRSLSVRRSGVH